MASLYRRRSALVLLLISCLISQVHSQSCNTDQNPYCAGNSQFAQLCCPYPAVCYYADRYGAVACCQAGQICRGTGITITAAQTTQITQVIQTTQTTQTTPPTQTTQTGGYSTVTITGAIATTAVASVVTTAALPATTVTTAIGYTTTAGVIIANGASWPLGTRHPTYVSVGLAILAWVMT